MEFQKAVLIIALVILVITIIIISAIINKSKQQQKWPPEEGSCPPYYTLGKVETEEDGSGGKPACIQQDPQRIIGLAGSNAQKCGTFKLLDNNGKPVKRRDRIKWAEECKVKWDGYN